MRARAGDCPRLAARKGRSWQSSTASAPSLIVVDSHSRRSGCQRGGAWGALVPGQPFAAESTNLQDVLSWDIVDSSCLGSSWTIDVRGLRGHFGFGRLVFVAFHEASGLPVADICCAFGRCWVADDFGSLVIEEHDDRVVVKDADLSTSVVPAHLKVDANDGDDACLAGCPGGRFQGLGGGRFGCRRNGRDCFRCRVPGLLGCGVSLVVLVGSLGVVIEVELVNLGLQGGGCGRRRLLAQELLQCVVQALVLALCGGLVRFPSHGFTPRDFRYSTSTPRLP